MSAFSFDASTVAPQTERTAWPKGKYKVAIVQSELKANSAGTGQVINFGRKALQNVDGGAVPTSLLLSTINIKNASEEAERIGKSEMSTVCHACGVLKITDTANLHGHEHIVDVDQEFVADKPEKRDDKGQVIGKHYNRIKAYYKADGSSIVATTGQPATPVAATAAPDWAKQQGPPATPPVASAPPTSAPVPPPPPAPAPTEPLYYINHKGANLSEIPENLAAVKARNLPVDEFFVCQFGTTDWVKGSLFAPLAQAATPPAGDVPPPWLKPQP